MLGIVLGILTIGLGCKGFTAQGLPWSKTKNITGKPAKVIGVICLALGLFWLVEGTWSMWQLVMPRTAGSSQIAPLQTQPASSAMLSIESVASREQFWKRQFTNNRRCSAEFPETPSRTVVDFKGSQVQQLNLRRRGIHAAYSLEYSGVPSGKRNSFFLSEIIDDFGDRLQHMAEAGNYKYSKLHEEQVTRDKVPGIRLVNRVGETTVALSEFFLVGETLYRANVVVPESKQNDPDIDRFFSSIRFLPQPDHSSD